MNHLCNKFIKRIICNAIASSIIISTFYGKSIPISNAKSIQPMIIETKEIINVDYNQHNANYTIDSIYRETPLVTTAGYATTFFNDDTIIIQESIVEQLDVLSSSETIPLEIDISDEEKWTSVSPSCEPYTMYVKVDLDSSINIRTSAITGKDNIIGGLHYGDQVKVIGYNTYDQSWSAIEYKGKTAFVCNNYLEEWVDLSLRKDTLENPKWDGTTKLNSINGRIQGPSGCETYYNLKMDRCIYYMNLLGYNYEVWVRDDGVKMFGDYIMVAANLDIRPKGSLVETSLGTGIVVDTGEFVNWDSTGIDIAVTW